jgi:2-oxoglutarate/2-oxoacid ferredoxin oxidoreductase subunit alpha
MPTRDLKLAMIGSGGDGVVTMGDLIAMAAARDGLNVMKTESYGPQIRGGESSCTVRISPDPIYSQGDFVDVMVVFGWVDYARFRSEIVASPDAIILHEESDVTPMPDLGLSQAARTIAVPFIQLAKETAGTTASKNIVTLGILAELFGLPNEPLRRAVENRFSKKKEAVLESNLKGFDGGVLWAANHTASTAARKLEYTASETKLLISGNEASALGAIHAGCRFFAGYPITPSSEVLHFLSEWMPRVGGSVVQTEDELSAIGAVIGGSFAGVKSMTATSGPGLSLMSETLGLASMAEIPAVIVNVQRGGPSTGNPTRSEQSDLFHSLYGSHGDAPRVVIAPSDAEDCFHTTVEAFNIAEEYQVPVIVLSDQLIGQRRETVPIDVLVHEVRDRRLPTDEELESYQRYRETPDGVSPMAIPGMQKGMYQTNGLEHDAFGQPNSMFLLHEKMNRKRFRKLDAIGEKYRQVRRYGPSKADVGILCWGSSKGAVKEAVGNAEARGEKVSAFVPQILMPFPERELQEFLASVDQIIVIELNYSAQFYKYLRTFVDLPLDRTHVYARSGGKHLTVAEVEEQISKVLDATVVRQEVMA